jgi:hypothetical protein
VHYPHSARISHFPFVISTLSLSQYAGIDTSIAPSPLCSSVVTAYEALGLGAFGSSGSVAISAMITQTLKALPVKVVYRTLWDILRCHCSRVM